MRRRRHKNPSDALAWTEIALIGAGLFLVYQVYTSLKNDLTPNITGPAEGQSWLNYLFGSGGTVDASGNFVEPSS